MLNHIFKPFFNPFFKHGVISTSTIATLFFSHLVFADGLSAHLDGGVSFSDLGHNQTISVYQDPSIQYQFDNSSEHIQSPFVGLGLAYQWDQLGAFKNHLAFSLGLTAYYLENSLNGVKTPVLLGTALPSLNYHVEEDSWAAMLEPKLINTAYSWQPYALVGLGVSSNQLNNYSEEPTDPNGGAAAMPEPFQNKTTNSFAWEFGLGVQHLFYTAETGQKISFALEYRYMNWGQMYLATYPGEGTRETPHFGTLTSNLLSASLIYEF